MSKDVITVHGEDVIVREDTAKAYRGVNWALISIAAFVIITLLLLFTFFFSAATRVPGPSKPAATNVAQ